MTWIEGVLFKIDDQGTGCHAEHGHADGPGMPDNNMLL